MLELKDGKRFRITRPLVHVGRSTRNDIVITDIGSFSTNYPWPGPTGFQEKLTGTLVPGSLYEAQLCERLR